MTNFSLDLAAGAAPIDAKRTRFRLWAPGQQAVSVAIDGGQTVAMKSRDGGWFEAELECPAGSRYNYVLGNGQNVPDPAARAQECGVHGASVVVDPNAYTWRHPDWRGRPWEEAVLYELHPGLCGGFAGVADRLPALKALGVTAVELMPINDFPGARNWGYDGVLPYAPAAAYGTPNELKALIDTAHGLELSMLLDVVYNHFGPDGNYLGAYAPQMFRSDIKTPWGSAIDFRRPEVRRFFTENALYWLMEYRFDGLRFDAVHAISEADWLDEMAAEVRARVEPGRHVHLVLEHEGNVAGHLTAGFDAQWNDDFHHVMHVLLTGEHEGYYSDYAVDPAQKLARSLAEGFIYQGQASQYRGGKKRGTPSAHLPPTAFVNFLQNHDQIGNRALGERLTALADPVALEAAIALLLLSPQIPMLFMGEEEASATPFFYFTDHHDALADAVREGRRAEFASFAAFADPARRETIPDPNAAQTFEASRPSGDGAHAVTRHSFYRELLARRHAEIVPRLKGTRSLGAVAIGSHAVAARWQLGDGATLSLAINLAREAIELPSLPGRLLFHTANITEGQLRSGKLGAQAIVVLLEPAR
jgi:malto-oligosyltrehalose trehalohydrolase